MDNEVLVSIVVPAYNVENYVERCLNSLLAQIYKNIEIIVIDDGSNDNTGLLCDNMAKHDKRISVFHQVNRGLSAARNKGIDNAKGEYITFVDSDDLVDPELISKMIEISRKEEADIVQCSVFAFINERDISNIKSKSFKIYSSRDMCENLLDGKYENSGVVWAKLYNRRLFGDLKFSVGKQHEDEFLVYKLFWNSNRIAVLDSQLYFYQSKRPGSIMHTGFSLKHLDGLEGAIEKADFFKHNEYSLYGKAECCVCYYEIDLIEKMKTSEQYEEKSKDLRKDLVRRYKGILHMSGIPLKKKIFLFMSIYAPQVKSLIKFCMNIN